MSYKNENFAIQRTTDWVLATFLFASGVVLKNIESTSDPRRFAFVFESTSEIDELIKSFQTGHERIEPLRLLNAQRDLKRRLHDFQDRLATDGRKHVE